MEVITLISKKIVLHFPHRLVDQPLVYRLVKDYDLEFNILKAYVTPKEEGLLILEVKGEEGNYKKGIKYLKENGVRLQLLSEDITRNEERCTHCGACVTVCPVAALVLNHETRKVDFYKDKCIACGLCVKACPPRAMEVKF